MILVAVAGSGRSTMYLSDCARAQPICLYAVKDIETQSCVNI
jgi:hypothetical protein